LALIVTRRGIRSEIGISGTEGKMWSQLRLKAPIGSQRVVIVGIREMASEFVCHGFAPCALLFLHV
jgi:hypothetical protein